MSNPAIEEREPLPGTHGEQDPSITGRAILSLAESSSDIDGFTARLQPHESLGLQHLQHEREIIRRINEGLAEDREPYRASSNPTTRIRKYISQDIDLAPGEGRDRTPIRRSRRLIIDYEEAVARLKDRLADDHPARQVFEDYAKAAGQLTKPRSTERLLSDADIRMHIFQTFTMLDEKAVREEIDRQVSAAQEIAG